MFYQNVLCAAPAARSMWTSAKAIFCAQFLHFSFRAFASNFFSFFVLHLSATANAVSAALKFSTRVLHLHRTTIRFITIKSGAVALQNYSCCVYTLYLDKIFVNAIYTHTDSEKRFCSPVKRDTYRFADGCRLCLCALRDILFIFISFRREISVRLQIVWISRELSHCVAVGFFLSGYFFV